MEDKQEKQLVTIQPKSLSPANLDEAIRFSQELAKSDFVPKDLQGKPGNILTCILFGQELGLGMVQSLQSVANINGRTAVFGDVALGLVRASGLLESISEFPADKALKEGKGQCTVKRIGEEPVTVCFSAEDAKKAGRWGASGPWSSYPGRMLQMRARSWALRDVFPDVLKGIAIEEEARDYVVEAHVDDKTTVVRPRRKSESKQEEQQKEAPAKEVTPVVEEKKPEAKKEPEAKEYVQGEDVEQEEKKGYEIQKITKSAFGSVTRFYIYLDGRKYFTEDMAILGMLKNSATAKERVDVEFKEEKDSTGTPCLRITKVLRV